MSKNLESWSKIDCTTTDNFFCRSCCGAGVAADAEVTTQMMSSNVELHSLSTGRPPLVVTVTRQLKQMLFRWKSDAYSVIWSDKVTVSK